MSRSTDLSEPRPFGAGVEHGGLVCSLAAKKKSEVVRLWCGGLLMDAVV